MPVTVGARATFFCCTGFTFYLSFQFLRGDLGSWQKAKRRGKKRHGRVTLGPRAPCPLAAIAWRCVGVSLRGAGGFLPPPRVQRAEKQGKKGGKKGKNQPTQTLQKVSEDCGLF